MAVARLVALTCIVSMTSAADGSCGPTTAEPSIRRVATLRAARAAHTATPFRSGGILFIGGMTAGGGSLATAERFDPRDNSIHEVGSLATPRLGHTATLLPDGRVLVAGGYNGEYLASLEVFDPSASQFRAAGSLALTTAVGDSHSSVGGTRFSSWQEQVQAWPCAHKIGRRPRRVT